MGLGVVGVVGGGGGGGGGGGKGFSRSKVTYGSMRRVTAKWVETELGLEWVSLREGDGEEQEEEGAPLVEAPFVLGAVCENYGV